jgi:hypothetical protein
MEQLVHQVRKVIKVQQVHKVPMVLVDPTEVQGNQENVVIREQQEIREPQENQVLLDETVQKVIKVKWDGMVWLDLLVNQVRVVILDLLDLKDRLDHKVEQVYKESTDHLETQDQKDQPVTKDRLVTKDQQDQQVITVYQEMLEHQDLQDLQDHQVTCQVFLQEVSGTGLMAVRKDQGGTEVRDRFLTMLKNNKESINWINTSQVVTNYSRTSQIFGRLSQTNM